MPKTTNQLLLSCLLALASRGVPSAHAAATANPRTASKRTAAAGEAPARKRTAAEQRQMLASYVARQQLSGSEHANEAFTHGVLSLLQATLRPLERVTLTGVRSRYLGALSRDSFKEYEPSIADVFFPWLTVVRQQRDAHASDYRSAIEAELRKRAGGAPSLRGAIDVLLPSLDDAAYARLVLQHPQLHADMDLLHQANLARAQEGFPPLETDQLATSRRKIGRLEVNTSYLDYRGLRLKLHGAPPSRAELQTAINRSLLSIAPEDID